MSHTRLLGPDEENWGPGVTACVVLSSAALVMFAVFFVVALTKDVEAELPKPGPTITRTVERRVTVTKTRLLQPPQCRRGVPCLDKELLLECPQGEGDYVSEIDMARVYEYGCWITPELARNSG
jgi:hypothetical protein